MRSSERTLADESHPGMRPSGNGIDLGRLDRLLHRHRRQDTRHRLRQGTLAGSGAADQKYIVTTACRDLHTAFRLLLPDDFREIHIGRNGIRQLRGLLQAGIFRRVPDQQVFLRPFPRKDADRFFQRTDTIYFRLPDFHRFHRGTHGQDTATETVSDRHLGIGQGPRDLTDFPVETEFSHDEILAEPGQSPLFGGCDDAQGDGKVVAAAVLTQIGGC